MTDAARPLEPSEMSVDPVLSPRPDLAASTASDGDKAPMTARVDRALRDGRQWCESRTHKARETVRNHPMGAAAGVMGLGVLMGLMLRR